MGECEILFARSGTSSWASMVGASPDYLPADMSGTTVQLRDFNPSRADGSPVAEAVDSDEPRGVAASPF